MNKICTSIEQSKKLMELGIDVDTADMCISLFTIITNGNKEIKQVLVPLNYSNVTECPAPDFIERFPTWSLSALLDIIPPYLGEFKDGIDFGFSKAMNSKWYSAHYIQLDNSGLASFNKTVTGDTAIDAAFEMVVWLKENGKI